MSGLFATLAAAARGDDRVLTARHQSAFEPDVGDARVSWHADSDDEEDAGRADGREDGQERTRFPTEAVANAAKPQQRASQPQRAQDGPADRMTPAPSTKSAHTIAQVSRQAPTAGQKAGEVARSRSQASDPPPASLLPGRASASPSAVAAATEREGAVPEHRLLSTPDEADRPADVILLPGSARAEDSGSLFDTSAPTDQLKTRPRDQASRTLTIGRIEVRPPAPTAKAPVAAYRATTIPRAMPRQSLDDYRRRGR